MYFRRIYHVPTSASPPTTICRFFHQVSSSPTIEHFHIAFTEKSENTFTILSQHFHHTFLTLSPHPTLARTAQYPHGTFKPLPWSSMVDIRSDMPNTLGLFVSTFALLIGFKTPSREIGSRMRFQNQILYWNAHTVLSNVKYYGKN